MSEPKLPEGQKLPPPQANPNLLRDRLANERTFLAWLRTGIAIASLGFVVARFDLFLQELARLSGQKVPESQFAIPIGVIMVVLGPVVVLLAAARFLDTERALLAGDLHFRRFVRTVIIAITIGAIVVGAGLAIHLLAAAP